MAWINRKSPPPELPWRLQQRQISSMTVLITTYASGNDLLKSKEFFFLATSYFYKSRKKNTLRWEIFVTGTSVIAKQAQMARLPSLLTLDDRNIVKHDLIDKLSLKCQLWERKIYRCDWAATRMRALLIIGRKMLQCTLAFKSFNGRLRWSR